MKSIKEKKYIRLMRLLIEIKRDRLSKMGALVFRCVGVFNMNARCVFRKSSGWCLTSLVV